MSQDPVEITKVTYNRIAPDYIKRKERSLIWKLANYVVVRKFIRRLPATSNDILIVGPAGGHTTLAIAKKYPNRNVQAIDASAAMVKEAERLKSKTNIANCTFEVADITSAKIGPTYDGVLCDGVLYHIPRQQLLALLKKFRNALADSGVLYANFKAGIGFELQENPVTFGGSPRAYWFYNEEELAQIFEEAGFEASIKPQRIPIFGEHFIEVYASPKPSDTIKY